MREGGWQACKVERHGEGKERVKEGEKGRGERREGELGMGEEEMEKVKGEGCECVTGERGTHGSY